MRLTIVALSVLALFGCDEQTSSPAFWGDPNALPAGGNSGPSAAAGLWSGALSLGNGNVVYNVFCLIAGNGKLACALANANGQPIGAITGTASANAITGSVATLPGFVLSNQAQKAGLTASDIVVFARSGLGGTVTFAGQTYTLAADFDTQYDIDSALATIARVYSSFDLNTELASLSVNADGSFFAQTATGCIIGGTLAVIEAPSNGYTLTAQVSNCATYGNGTYTGAAFTRTNSTLEFMAVGDNGALLGSAHP